MKSGDRKHFSSFFAFRVVSSGSSYFSSMVTVVQWCRFPGNWGGISNYWAEFVLLFSRCCLADSWDWGGMLQQNEHPDSLGKLPGLLLHGCSTHLMSQAFFFKADCANRRSQNQWFAGPGEDTKQQGLRWSSQMPSFTLTSPICFLWRGSTVFGMPCQVTHDFFGTVPASSPVADRSKLCSWAGASGKRKSVSHT